MPPFTTSLRWIAPSTRVRPSPARPPPEGCRRARDRFDHLRDLPRHGAAALVQPAGDRVDGALPHLATAGVHPAHPGRAEKGMKVGGNCPLPPACRSRRANRSFASTTMLRPSGVSSARDASWHGRPAPRSPRRQRHELDCLAISKGDRAGLVEQQGVHVAGRFHRPAADRDHIVLGQAIHPGDADRGEQPANGRGDEADQQRDQHRHRNGDRRCRPRAASA